MDYQYKYKGDVSFIVVCVEKTVFGMFIFVNLPCDSYGFDYAVEIYLFLIMIVLTAFTRVWWLYRNLTLLLRDDCDETNLMNLIGDSQP